MSKSKHQFADMVIQDWLLPTGVKPGLTGYEDCCPEIPKDVINKQLKLERDDPEWFMRRVKK